MNHDQGLIVSEIITAIITVCVVLAVIFGLYVSNQRNDMVAAAQATMDAIKKKAGELEEESAPISCSNDFVSAETLANEYLPITIVPATIDPINASKGYGLGIQIHTNKSSDSGDTFDTAQRLYKIIVEENKGNLRNVNKEDDELEYSVLLSESPLCSV